MQDLLQILARIGIQGCRHLLLFCSVIRVAIHIQAHLGELNVSLASRASPTTSLQPKGPFLKPLIPTHRTNTKLGGLVASWSHLFHREMQF
jgi:hypothetical protein